MISYWNDITFSEKDFFWLFCLLPLMTMWYIVRLRKQEADFNYSSLQNLGKVKASSKAAFRHSMFLLRLIAVSFLILTLARPQSRSSWKDIKAEGIDIVMSLDVSYSMLAKDFKPNR